jgi:methylmalonyl-CoA mutase N-terminal domain/subunit
MAKKEITEKDLRKVVLESGIEVKPIYRPEDIKDLDYERDIGNPGEFPFTRGIHKFMYRYRPWTMRQYSGFGTPEDTNSRFKFLIENGQNALNVAFDLPTQNGLDSDNPLAKWEVGRVGMAVDTLKDMEIAFDGIPIDKISTSLTINATAPIILAMYFVVAEKQGVDLKDVRATPQNDILKEIIGRGAWIFPVEPSVKLVCDIIEFCARNAPKVYPVSVCGYHIRESGATPAQEMGYAFSIAETYIDKVLERGLKVDEFVPRFSFNFDIFGNMFEQIAKLRAGRRLWARIIRDKYGAKNSASMKMKMIAGGGGAGLTFEQPENNIVRGAYYALVSALSGTQTMALCTFDEAYTIPSAKASLLALRTMQILMEETGVCDTVDPLGGSYYIEWLTNEMEKKIIEVMEEVESWGGMINAVERGYIQSKIARQAYEMEKKIQSGEIVKVGVNKYRMEEEEKEIELYDLDMTAVKTQLERLKEVKNERNNLKVKESLEELKKAIKRDENLMPYIIEAVRHYATVGEITQVLKDEYGVFKEPPIF